MKPPRLRAFEELMVGEFRQSRSRVVMREEIIDFAKKYDPQWFHTDPDAAKASVFGEVVASGVHVLALWRQLDHEINQDVDFVCGVGFDEFRLKSGLRGGDEFRVTSHIVDMRPSASTPHRGTVITHYQLVKTSGAVVLDFKSINLVYTRTGQQARAAGTL